MADDVKKKEAEAEEGALVFRGRKLGESTEIWSFNTWDDIRWDATRESEAETITSSQLSFSPHIVIPNAAEVIVEKPAASRWDHFYAQHNRWFFKDRNWLSSEFPELLHYSTSSILEVGCGVGNTVFPILRARKNEPALQIHACDFSSGALDLLRSSREFDPQRIHAFHHDLSCDECFEGISEGSIDVVVAIFVLSALLPSRLPFVLGKIFRVLKPGGILLFRDYGKYDMTQLRFKPARLIRPNLYIRGDGTAVHYFTVEEIGNLVADAGFEVLKNDFDRRLLVNRFRKLTMYRVWIQGKYCKKALDAGQP